MKTNFKSILILCIAIIIANHFNSIAAQEKDDMVKRAEMLEEGKIPENLDPALSGREIRTDTTSITLGRRQIIVIEKNGTTDVSITDILEDDQTKSPIRSKRGFKGHWRGLELGLNNFMNSDFSLSLSSTDDFMELEAIKSWNVNLNIIQYDFVVAGDNFGLLTGLGFEFNDYRFSNNNNIKKENKVIVPREYDDLGIKLDKTKLSAVYIAVPLLVEYQTNHPRHSRRAYFSAGVIGGLNIGSHTKVVYNQNSSRQKNKDKGDFYLSPFRYGLTFRAGYRSLNLFANYYPTSLFQKNKGPELYPVAVGFSILGF